MLLLLRCLLEACAADKDLQKLPPLESVEIDFETSKSLYLQNLYNLTESNNLVLEKYILEDLDIQTKIDSLLSCGFLTVEKKKTAIDKTDDLENFFEYFEQIQNPIFALENLENPKLNKKEVLTKLIEKNKSKFGFYNEQRHYFILYDQRIQKSFRTNFG